MASKTSKLMFANPEFVYIFTADIGGYIKIQQKILDLDSFRLFQLQKDPMPIDKIVDERFLKKNSSWKMDYNR